ncbi:hypothetical protein K0817_009300 [Microbacterium sp. HD4P20]|uniref:hypothetical protein n=1 Tax=Microbacterium sp. HD4P20 TaxID=2864874 RepID=UPI001C6442BD|nr:hypothetical protein [Microbacterium sp. HD4P20]MCP2636759.1 hypothetical protein [Microbacterium sp. HD4P20]
MTYITREYEEGELMERISELRPSLVIPDNVHLVGFKADVPTGNTNFRTLEVTLGFRFTHEEWDRLLANPSA